MIKSGLLVTGILVYGAVAWETWSKWINGHSYYSEPLAYSGSLAFCVFTAPIFVLAGGILLSRSYPKETLLISILQYFSYYLLQPIYLGLGNLEFMVIVLAPWIVGTAIHVVKMPRKRTIYSFIFFNAVLIVLLMFVEVWFRGSSRLNENFYYKNKVRELWWVENAPILFKNRAQKNVIEILGGRYSREYPLGVHNRKKPLGAYRIICLGSSSTEGTGSSDWSLFSYPEQLERILTQRASTNIEVVNGGIGGAPFYMLEVYLKDVLLQLDPDLVIIYFGVNGDNMASRICYQRLRDEVADAPFIQSIEELWAAMHLRWNPPWMIRGFLGLARLRIFMSILIAVDNLRNTDLLKMSWVLSQSGGQRVHSLSQSPEETISVCVKQSRKVVLVPEVLLEDIYNGTVSHEYYRIFRTLEEKYAGKGVYYKDISNAFGPENASLYFIDRMHMNDQGYHFLAMQIANFLINEGIISSN